MLLMSPLPTTAAATGRAGLRRINPVSWSAPLGFDQGQLHTGVASVLTIAGQGPVDAGGHLLHADDVPAQLALALANVEAVLAEAGLTPADLAQLRVYVTDMAAVLDAYDALVEYLQAAGATPPVTLVEVSRLALPGMVVEIDGLAIRCASS
jgi:enamine deaminase RidA (YjgF/YER057c/UK114 family)